MRRSSLLIPLALTLSLLGAQTTWAQNVDDSELFDPGLEADLAAEPTPTDPSEADGADDGDGNFSRAIPGGLATTLSDAERAAYQARLDDAQTPQDRNAVRQELQRQHRERHTEQVQAQKTERKGLFESMRDDFNSIMDGSAARSKNRGDNDGQLADASGDKDRAKDRGKNGNGGGGGKNGGRGGGNGGGKNK